MTSCSRGLRALSARVRPVAHAACLCLSVVAGADAAFAQTQDSALSGTQVAALSPVVVTATRTPMRVDQTVAEVSVLERADLERANGRTLAEVLSQQAGVQFSSNGGLGKSSSLFMRGLEARHVLLLVDGVRYGSATTGTADFDNLPLGDVERIEIVRGPMSGLYGSDAVGGVIQVFTRRATQGTRFNAVAAAGSKGYAQGGGGLSWADGPLSAAVQVLHTENSGFSATNSKVPYGSYNADADGFRQNAGSLNLGMKLPAGWALGAHLLESKGRTDIDDGEGAAAVADLRTQVASVDAQGQVLPGWRTVLRAARSLNEYNTLSSASAWTELGTIATTQHQLSWENTISLPVGALVAIAEHVTQKVTKPGADYDITERDINSLALGYNGVVGAHSWQASVRRDHNSQYGNETTGSAGYGYAFAPGWRATASAGTSFTAPSFNSLYWPSYGNPLLEPERGRHAELGLRYVTGTHQFSASAYANRIRGYITAGAHPSNLPYVRSRGLSLGYEGQIDAFKLGAALDELHAVTEQSGSANDGNMLPRRAKHSAKFSADWERGAWTVGSALQAYSHRWDEAANTNRLAGYALLDLHAQWAFQRDWALQARLNNVADRAYETALGYNQPGRELYVALRYSPR